MTTIILQAQCFAEGAHLGQTRKYTGERYFKHLHNVAQLVASTPNYSDLTVAAAYLHDVLEDTPCTYPFLVRLFNRPIADLVLQVTDQSKPSDGNRATRKAIDRHHLSLATPEAKTIKLADLIDNTKSIRQHDPSFAKTYLAEKRLLLPFLKEGNSRLYELAWETIQ